jgi:hypothetical protein
LYLIIFITLILSAQKKYYTNNNSYEKPEGVANIERLLVLKLESGLGRTLAFLWSIKWFQSCSSQEMPRSLKEFKYYWDYVMNGNW